MIFGERIRQAREICGFTQTELAKRIGVKQAAVAQYERGQIMPSDEALRTLAKETGFLTTFFEQEPSNIFTPGTLSFRARNTLTKKDHDMAYQSASSMFDLIAKSEKVIGLPMPRLPRITDLNNNPSGAAKITRTSLGIAPEIPIKNLTRTLEKNGIIILKLPIFLAKLDAFSTWVKTGIERPVIVFVSGKQPDRVRFSMSHELGHLVIHQPLKGQYKIIENEANTFAGEFLLPENAIRNEIVPPITLSSIAKLKPRWGVSIQALISRAYELNIISNRQYRYLFEQLSARNWRTKEPDNLDIQPEIPIMYRKIIELAYNDIEQYSKDMHLAYDRAQKLSLFA